MPLPRLLDTQDTAKRTEAITIFCLRPSASDFDAADSGALGRSVSNTDRLTTYIDPIGSQSFPTFWSGNGSVAEDAIQIGRHNPMAEVLSVSRGSSEGT